MLKPKFFLSFLAGLVLLNSMLLFGQDEMKDQLYLGS